MPEYAYQRSVQIHRKNVKTEETRQPFLAAYTSNLYEAMKRLNGTEFKVYLYLLSNKNGYSFDFSPQEVANKTGVCRDSARNAFDAMIHKSFIIPTLDGKYEFYEVANPALRLEREEQLWRKFQRFS